MDIGNKLRQLRKAQLLTQEELADRADLTKGFISQLENDQSSPSVETLIDILRILDVSPADFFQDNETNKVVWGKSDQLDWESSDLVDFRLLVPRAINRELDPAIVELKPGGRTDTDKMHEGEEFGYVISGEVTLVLGKESHRVRRGECFLFYPRQNHYLENRGKRPARVIWVTTPPTH